MSGEPNHITPLSLSEINSRIRQVLKENFPDNFWVVAEISEMKVNAAGHCYLELIEKDNLSGKTIAKARGNIWAFTFRLLRPYFETTARINLTAGLKVLVQAQVEFHELYGYSLNITDIDPAYTMGDMARQRAVAIERLKAEGVYDMNKSLELPLVIQKIAVISSSTAAGFGDFKKHLLQNDGGYKFTVRLFPALMQGEEAVESLISALEKINNMAHPFEAVVIIRGGGSQSDLSCFDDYWLASHVAQFPLPVLTGIGHERDESVVDLVANTSLKTPTAVADFILSRAQELDGYLYDLQSQFVSEVKRNLEQKRSELLFLFMKFAPRMRDSLQRRDKKLLTLGMTFRKTWSQNLASQLALLNGFYSQSRNSSQHILSAQRKYLSRTTRQLQVITGNYIKRKQAMAVRLAQLIQSLDPVNVLKRGYSISYHHGRLLKNSEQVDSGDTMETQLHSGRITSKVTGKNTQKETETDLE